MHDTENQDAAVQGIAPAEEGGWVWWLGAIATLPWVGGWVSLCLMLMPFLPVVMVAEVLGFDFEEGRAGGVFLVAVSLVSVAWLRFLRRHTGLSLSFYFIPCIWILVGAVHDWRLRNALPC